MKLIRMLNNNLKRAIFSKRFIIAVVLIALFEYMDVFWMIYENMSGKAKYTLVSLLISFGNTMFWGMAFTSALIPYSHIFSDDKDNNTITYMSVRSSKCSYAAAAVMACGISAFICTIIGSIIFLLAAAAFCDPCSPRTLETYGDYARSLSKGNYWEFITGNVILTGLRSSFFALIGLLVSGFVKNKPVIYATPILTYFFFTKFGYFYLHLPVYIDVIPVYMTYVFGGEHEMPSIAYAFAFTVCTCILTIYAINKRVRRIY